MERIDEPIPTLGDVKRISSALPDRYALVPWIAALGGLRKGEILGLAPRNVSIQQGTLGVERALQVITGTGPVFVAPETSSSVRTVPSYDYMISDTWPER